MRDDPEGESKAKQDFRLHFHKLQPNEGLLLHPGQTLSIYHHLFSLRCSKKSSFELVFKVPFPFAKYYIAQPLPQGTRLESLMHSQMRNLPGGSQTLTGRKEPGL